MSARHDSRMMVSNTMPLGLSCSMRVRTQWSGLPVKKTVIRWRRWWRAVPTHTFNRLDDITPKTWCSHHTIPLQVFLAAHSLRISNRIRVVLLGETYELMEPPHNMQVPSASSFRKVAPTSSLLLSTPGVLYTAKEWLWDVFGLY